jgi:ankyrin repeat protein
MKNGANPARRDSTGATPLENAVRLRRADAVRALLAQDAGASGRESGLLDEAVLRGDIETVRMLTTAGADVDARGVAGATPLDDAALKGQTEIARILLDHGARVDARNAWGATPLQDAALGGHTPVAKLLIDRGADVNARESESGSTPLYSAAAMGHTDMAELLLEHGADPAIANKEGRNAARAAKDNGFTGLAASLHEYSQLPADARAATLKARFAAR